jgi:hypothetical protein
VEDPVLIVGDLFIRHQTAQHDAESLLYYDAPDVSEKRWVVNCRNPRSPLKTSLPIGFATYNDALRALHALAEAGLSDTNLMHRRIKVDRDWVGVRRIMLEGLPW